MAAAGHREPQQKKGEARIFVALAPSLLGVCALAAPLIPVGVIGTPSCRYPGILHDSLQSSLNSAHTSIKLLY